MKRIIPAIFIAVAALLACFLLVRRFFEQNTVVQRSRLVTPLVDTGDVSSAKNTSEYDDDYAETSFITLAQDETLLSTVTMDIDGDGYDDQINVIKTSSSQFIVLVVALYDAASAKYERVASLATVVTQVRTFACTSLDVIGNHHNALVYQGIAPNGHSVLRMYLGSRDKRKRFQIECIGDFDTDGTVFIQQLDRDESYALSQAKGMSFPVWVYSSETQSGSARTDQLQTEYNWNEKERKYVQVHQSRVPGSSIAAKELARIQDGTVETFSRFLDGLWYKTENASRTIRYIFFDSTAHEIIFENGDSEEVYSWLNSNMRRGGMYFTAVNTSIENLQRRVDISLTGIDEIRIRLQDDVRMIINESTQWDGSYKKMAIQNTSAAAGKDTDAFSALTSGQWKTGDGMEVAFEDDTYRVKGSGVSDQGRFMKLSISGDDVLQFRSDTAHSYFRDTYTFDFQKVEKEVQSGRRTVKKIVDDLNTVIFHHVIVRPDGYYVTEEKPLVLTRIPEENEKSQ